MGILRTIFAMFLKSKINSEYKVLENPSFKLTDTMGVDRESK